MLRFPDPDTLRLALGQEAVPTDVRRAAAIGAAGPDGALWLEPQRPLSEKIRYDLLKLGVDIHPADPPPTDPVCCWHQLLGLLPDQTEATPDTVVLFEIIDHALWPVLTGEIRRFRSTAAKLAWRLTSEGAVLLRAVGPPLGTLLRAGCPGRLHAYVEQAPRVWVQAGWRHPLAGDIEVSPGQLLRIRAPRDWAFLDAASFQEEPGKLCLPAPPTAIEPTAARDVAVTVPVRLASGVSREPAELWVLRDRPFEQLAELLREQDESLLALLRIAAVEDASGPVIVLHGRAPKRTPPVLVLHAESYRPYLRLPNLFLPVGQRLQPVLRRDVVRNLLAFDGSLFTWLVPQPGGAFTAERVPGAAFVPLADLVDYIRDSAPIRFEPWVQSNTLELTTFLPRDEDVPAEFRSQFRRKAPPEIEKPRPGSVVARLGEWFQEAVASLPRWLSRRSEEVPSTAAASSSPSGEAPDPLAAAVQKFLQPARATRPQRPEPMRKPSSNRTVEDRFLHMPGALDAPARVALWPKLAGFYQGEKKWADAAVCWMNALWEADALSPLWLWGWFHAEAQAAHWDPDRPGDELERCLLAALPDAADARAVAAFTTWATQQQPPVAALEPRLGLVAQYLEANEHFLPIRGAWLAWGSLSRLAAGDLLSLARARDRLLERLFRTGLSFDHDLPGFLRYAGTAGAAFRSEPIRAWLLRQRDGIHRWIDALHDQPTNEPVRQERGVLTTARLQGKQPPFGPAGEAYCTRAYADLTLAWGLARLGAASEACQLWRQARVILATRDAVHRFLLEAYSYRIQQVLDGQPAEGPLLPELLDDLQHLEDLERYKVDWLRKQSRILEPSERVDPYHGDVQREHFDNLNPVLARLPEIGDRSVLKQRIAGLLAEAPEKASALPRVLKAALEQAPRIDEAFAVELLGRVAATLDEMPAAPETAPLLEKALFVAAHFEQTVYVQQFIGRFQHLLDRRHGPEAARAFASLAEQSFRGLRKLGMRDEIDRLLKQMAECILQGQSLANLRLRMGVNIAGVLPTLLHVAGVWFYEGKDSEATAVLDEVRALLFARQLTPTDQANLARAYAGSLAQAPPSVALDRLEELFRKLDRINDGLTTRSHFSLAQLSVIEAMVLAVVDANFTLGTTVRRWLDEDEYLVRRRIHRDLRGLMG